MKAADWIDRLKAKRGWDTDYRAAKELGLSRNTISNYRSGTPTLDEQTALKVAAALGEKPEVILVDQAMERAKHDDARTALGRALARLGGAAAVAAVVVGIGGPPPSAAATVADSPALYIMSSRTKRRRRSATRWMADMIGSLTPRLAAC